MLIRSRSFFLTFTLVILIISACSNREESVPNELKPEEIVQKSPDKANEVIKRFEQGVSLYDANNLDEAKAIFEETLTLDSSNGTYDFYLGNIARKQNDFPRAIVHYQNAVNKSPNLMEAYNNLTALQMAAQNFDEALATSTKGLEIQPDYADLIFKKAQILYVKQQNEESNKLLLNLIENPNYFEAHRFLGLNYIILNDKKNAVEHLSKYLEIAPEGVQAKEKVKQILGELEKSN